MTNDSYIGTRLTAAQTMISRIVAGIIHWLTASSDVGKARCHRLPPSLRPAAADWLLPSAVARSDNRGRRDSHFVMNTAKMVLNVVTISMPASGSAGFALPLRAR